MRPRKGIAGRALTPEEIKTSAAARACDYTVLTHLDLSRPPGEAELIAAGNLGQPLTPTRTANPAQITNPAQKVWQERDNLTFGTAIQAWNEHRYEDAFTLFEQHIKNSPNSPWAAESQLHLGCYCQYKGRYLEAAEHFEDILKTVPSDHRMHQKAKLRRSILHLDQGNLEESRKGFAEMYRSDPDPDHKTYASYWIREISLLGKHETALRDCGQRALARVCELRDDPAAASDLRHMTAAGPHGFTARELMNTALMQGLDPEAVYASTALEQLPTPFIAHYSDRHFVTVENVTAESVTLHDTRVNRTHEIPRAAFEYQWSGFAVVFDQVPEIAVISRAADTDSIVGGCCGFPRYPSELGDDPCAEKNCGMPGWSINTVNMNFRVQDTPMWWNPPYGPEVEISLLFNSLDSLNNMEPFGPKWAFTYASYLLIDPGQSATVRDGDGRFLSFTHPGSGSFPLSYERPAGDDRDLVQTDTNDFELIQPDGTVYLYGIPAAMQGNSDVPLLLSITDRHGNSLTIEHNAQGAILALRHSALPADPQANPPTDPKWAFVYDPNLPVSRVTRIEDPFGRSCHFGYDAENRLDSQIDMGGLQYGYTYTIKNAEDVNDLLGGYPPSKTLPISEELFISGIQTPKGWTTIYTEPADGDQSVWLTVYPPSGGPMGRNYRITITDPEDYAQEYHFDGASTETWHRDAEQLAKAVADSNESKGWSGPYTEYGQGLVEGRGKVNRARMVSPQENIGVYQAYSHDSISRQDTEFTDATGETTWRGYYSSGAGAGRLEWVRLPKSYGDPDTDYEIRFTYAANGKDLRTIKRDQGGVEKTLLDITYYANRDPHVVTDALGRTLTYTWHTNGMPNTITIGSSSDVITYDYDSNWRPAGIKINNQTVFTTAYDLEGRLRSTLDAAGYFVTLDYDDLNRLTREEHPDDSFIERIWECCHIGEIRSGKITGGGDRMLERTVFAHDGRGLPTRVTDTAGRVTRFGYDGASRLQTLTDANKNETTWEYDDFGRISKKIFPNLSEENIYWQNAEQMERIVNRRQQTTWFYYDAHSRIDYIDAPDFTTDYIYDNWDRIERIEHTPADQSMQAHDFEHDLLGRIKEIDGPWTDDTISWVYNDALRKVTRTTPGSVVTETVTDSLGRIASVTNTLGLFTHNYTGESSKPDSIIHTNGLANGTPYSGFDTLLTWYDDDQRQALETITSKLPGGNIIAKHTYGYDSLGRIDSWKREAILANPSGVTRSFEWSTRHDFASQLASVAEKTLAGVIQGAWDYSYDPAGNIASVQTSTGPANLAAITNRGHNSLNQINSFGGGGPTTIRGTLDEPGKASVGIVGQGDKPARMIQDNRFETELPLQVGNNSISVTALDGNYNRSDYVFAIDVASAASRSFSHDDDGNLLSDGIRSYEWDSQSRLTKITWTTGKTTEFRYNALGQRSEQIEKTSGSVTAYHYFLLDGIELVNRYTGGTAASNIDRRYFDQGEQRHNGTTWDNLHYCRDHLGSVREVVNSDGNLLARYDFDPYGKRSTQYQATTYTGGCDIGYTGHHTLPSPVAGQTEMVMTFFRVYDPEFGRWLSIDPIGEDADINLYRYVRGNPAQFTDPFGLEVDSVTTGITSAIAQGDIAALESIMAGTEGAQAAACRTAISRLKTPVGNLVRATLKRSKSYRSELAEKTYAEVIRLAKYGDKAARRAAQQMLKLIKEEERLMGKCGGK